RYAGHSGALGAGSDGGCHTSAGRVTRRGCREALPATARGTYRPVREPRDLRRAACVGPRALSGSSGWRDGKAARDGCGAAELTTVRRLRHDGLALHPLSLTPQLALTIRARTDLLRLRLERRVHLLPAIHRVYLAADLAHRTVALHGDRVPLHVEREQSQHGRGYGELPEAEVLRVNAPLLAIAIDRPVAGLTRDGSSAPH